MGRMMPLECEHGYYIDGGDFIDEADVGCPECDRANERLRVRFARWLLRRATR